MEEFEKQLKILQNRVESLSAENQKIKKKEYDRVKKEYQFIINAISNVVDSGDLVQNRFQNLKAQIETTNILIDITEINNPNSNVLGFRFVDIIFGAVEKHFIHALEKNEDKSRFRSIIDRVVKNPIINAVLHSNPITSLVSSVIDKATNFFTATRVGQKVKEIDIEIKSVFNEERITGFYRSIEKYVKFYDKLIEAKTKYDFSINELDVKYVHLADSFSGYYTKFLSDLGIVSNSSEAVSIQLRNIVTPLVEDGQENYQGILEKEPIQKAFEKSKNFVALKQQIEQYIADYHTVLNGYLKACVAALNFAESLIDASTDNSKLLALKTKIEGFLVESE